MTSVANTSSRRFSSSLATPIAPSRRHSVRHADEEVVEEDKQFTSFERYDTETVGGVRRAFSGTLLMMVEQSPPTTRVTKLTINVLLPLALMVVEWLQLMYYSLRDIGRDTPIILMVLKIIQIDVPVNIYSASIIFWGCHVVVWVAAVVSLATAVFFYRGHPKAPGKLGVLLRTVVFALASFFYLPVQRQFWAAIFCDVGFSRATSLVGDRDGACWTGLFAVPPILSILGLAFLTPLAWVVALNNFPADPHSADIFKRAHPRNDLLAMMLKTAATIAIFISKLSRPVGSLIVAFCAVCMFLLLVALQPYFNNWANKLRAALYAVFMITSVVAFGVVCVPFSLGETVSGGILYAVLGIAILTFIISYFLVRPTLKSRRFDHWLQRITLRFELGADISSTYALHLEALVKTPTRLGRLANFLAETRGENSPEVYYQRAAAHRIQGAHTIDYAFWCWQVDFSRHVQAEVWYLEHCLNRLPENGGVLVLASPSEVDLHPLLLEYRRRTVERDIPVLYLDLTKDLVSKDALAATLAPAPAAAPVMTRRGDDALGSLPLELSTVNNMRSRRDTTSARGANSGRTPHSASSVPYTPHTDSVSTSEALLVHGNSSSTLGLHTEAPPRPTRKPVPFPVVMYYILWECIGGIRSRSLAIGAIKKAFKRICDRAELSPSARELCWDLLLGRTDELRAQDGREVVDRLTDAVGGMLAGVAGLKHRDVQRNGTFSSTLGQESKGVVLIIAHLEGVDALSLRVLRNLFQTAPQRRLLAIYTLNPVLALLLRTTAVATGDNLTWKLKFEAAGDDWLPLCTADPTNTFVSKINQPLDAQGRVPEPLLAYRPSGQKDQRTATYDTVMADDDSPDKVIPTDPNALDLIRARIMPLSGGWDGVLDPEEPGTPPATARASGRKLGPFETLPSRIPNPQVSPIKAGSGRISMASSSGVLPVGAAPVQPLPPPPKGSSPRPHASPPRGRVRASAPTSPAGTPREMQAFPALALSPTGVASTANLLELKKGFALVHQSSVPARMESVAATTVVPGSLTARAITVVEPSPPPPYTPGEPLRTVEAKVPDGLENSIATKTRRPSVTVPVRNAVVPGAFHPDTTSSDDEAPAQRLLPSETIPDMKGLEEKAELNRSMRTLGRTASISEHLASTLASALRRSEQRRDDLAERVGLIESGGVTPAAHSKRTFEDSLGSLPKSFDKSSGGGGGLDRSLGAMSVDRAMGVMERSTLAVEHSSPLERYNGAAVLERAAGMDRSMGQLERSGFGAPALERAGGMDRSMGQLERSGFAFGQGSRAGMFDQSVLGSHQVEQAVRAQHLYSRTLRSDDLRTTLSTVVPNMPTYAQPDLALPISRRGRRVVMTVLARRLRSTPGALDLLRLAAVIGRSAPLDVLLKLFVTSQGASAFHGLVDALVEEKLLYRHNFQQSWYAFSSSLIQRVVYESLSDRERGTMHDVVGKSILSLGNPPHLYTKILAWRHFTRAGDTPSVLPTLVEIARECDARAAYRRSYDAAKDAAEKLKEATARGEQSPGVENTRTMLDMLLIQARAAFSLGNYAVARGALGQAGKYARTPMQAARITELAAEMALSAGDHNQADTLVRNAITSLAQDRSSPVFVELYLTLGETLLAARNYAEAAVAFMTASRAARQMHLIDGEASALLGMGTVQREQSEFGDSRVSLNSARRMFRWLGNRHKLDMVVVELARMSLYRGHPTEARMRLKGLVEGFGRMRTESRTTVAARMAMLDVALVLGDADLFRENAAALRALGDDLHSYDEMALLAREAVQMTCEEIEKTSYMTKDFRVPGDASIRAQRDLERMEWVDRNEAEQERLLSEGTILPARNFAAIPRLCDLPKVEDKIRAAFEAAEKAGGQDKGVTLGVVMTQLNDTLMRASSQLQTLADEGAPINLSALRAALVAHIAMLVLNGLRGNPLKPSEMELRAAAVRMRVSPDFEFEVRSGRMVFSGSSFVRWNCATLNLADMEQGSVIAAAFMKARLVRPLVAQSTFIEDQDHFYFFSTPSYASDIPPPSQLRATVARMQDEDGVPLRTVQSCRDVYPDCFRGHEAVEWLLNPTHGALANRHQAVVFLQTMLETRLLVCVQGRATFGDNLLYRFPRFAM